MTRYKSGKNSNRQGQDYNNTGKQQIISTSSARNNDASILMVVVAEEVADFRI